MLSFCDIACSFMGKTHLLLRVFRDTEQSKNMCNNIYSEQDQMSDELGVHLITRIWAMYTLGRSRN